MLFLTRTASKACLREAENARKNRAEIIRALSHGQVTRRDLIRMGLMTAAGSFVLRNGLSIYAKSAYAAIPTGAPPSPLFGVQPFSAAMPRFDVLVRHPEPGFLNPAPTAEANTTQQRLNQALEGVKGGDTGPIEGRPPGPIWAHQDFARFPPRIAVVATMAQAQANTTYNPQVAPSFNSGIDASASFRPTFHPGLPDQGPLALWTFNGTIPPKLMMVRYGEPLLFRHRNNLPFDVTQNGGFGRHTISIHSGA